MLVCLLVPASVAFANTGSRKLGLPMLMCRYEYKDVGGGTFHQANGTSTLRSNKTPVMLAVLLFCLAFCMQSQS